MSEYMMIFHNRQPECGPTPADLEAYINRWQNWIAGLAATVEMTDMKRLEPAGRSVRDEKIHNTDGPHPDGTEVVGGYVIIKANSIEEASELAKGCPGTETGGYVEVRPVMVM